MKEADLKADCDFCLQHYGEFGCRFYVPQTMGFAVKSERSNGKVVVCECCDYTEDEDEEEEEEGKEPKEEKAGEDDSGENKAGDTSDTASDQQLPTGLKVDPPPSKRSRTETLDNNTVAAEENDATASDNQQLQPQQPTRIQAGWYGKGYGKFRSRRRKS